MKVGKRNGNKRERKDEAGGVRNTSGGVREERRGRQVRERNKRTERSLKEKTKSGGMVNSSRREGKREEAARKKMKENVIMM